MVCSRVLFGLPVQKTLKGALQREPLARRGALYRARAPNSRWRRSSGPQVTGWSRPVSLEEALRIAAALDGPWSGGLRAEPDQAAD